MQEIKQSCPVCLSTLKTAKPDTVLVCSSCNNSLFAYEDKQKQVKVMPFHLGIQIKAQNQSWIEQEEEYDDELAPEEAPFTKNQ